ncbi:MAG: recombinase RecT [Faecalibacterium prausnitzii]
MQSRATLSQAASPANLWRCTSADGQHDDCQLLGRPLTLSAPRATDAECKIFLETCKQYRLNPFTKEAYLIHYDNNSEETPSTIVLGKNCYLQMAERHPSYDGFEAGVIIFDKVAGDCQKRRVPSFTRTRSFWAAGPRSTAKTAPVPATRK